MHTIAEEYLKKNDKMLGSIIVSVGSCRLDHNSRNRFDVIASSIISQQLSAKAAKTIKGRILDHTGGSHTLNVEALATAKVDDLREAGLSNAKANYVIGLANNIVSGSLNLDDLGHQSDENILETLTAQKGIGRWTAEMFLIFALGRKDVLSTGDAGLLRSAQQLYKLDSRPTAAEFTIIAEKWRPYRSVASWYLWRNIDK